MGTHAMTINYLVRLTNRFPELADDLLPVHPQIFSCQHNDPVINSLISYRDQYGCLTLAFIINQLPTGHHIIVLPLADITSGFSFFSSKMPLCGSNKMEFLEAFVELINITQIQMVHANEPHMYSILETYRSTQDLPWPNDYFLQSNFQSRSCSPMESYVAAQQKKKQIAMHHSGIGPAAPIIL